MIQLTLSIVKPDAVSRGLTGEILNRFDKLGFKIRAMKRLRLTRTQAEGFYHVHRQRPFFQSLTEFMASGPVVVLILEGEDIVKRYREAMGATNPRDAAPGTIRKDLGTDIEHNVVHGSDSPDTAAFEISYFFPGIDLVE